MVDVHAVLDQIGQLEKAPFSRGAKTKREAPLSGPLQGLFHKHWFQASFLVTNLLNETEKNGDALLRKHLDARFGKDKWIGETISEQQISAIVHAMVDGALTNRIGRASRTATKSRMTGEWIVFAQMNGRNVYLTLGGHEETNENVLARCTQALQEFPELRCLPCFEGAPADSNSGL